MPESLVGQVTHFFDRISVAVIKLTGGSLKVGGTIHVVGKAVEFTQTVGSMQVEHQDVQSGKKGDEVAIKVDQPVKEKDQVFKVTA